MSKRTTLFIRIFSLNILLLLFSTLLFQTCSDDNSPTEPEAQPSLASATIGSGGGTLKTDDFELLVPVGAFPIDTKLTLSLVENEETGFDNIISREFKIEGLPQSFSEPLTLKIKYSGELSDSSYIAVGENVWVTSLDSENQCYRLIEGRDSSDCLVAVIPPISDDVLLKSELNSTNKEDNKSTTSVLAISGYSSYLSEQKHFKIDFPSSVPTEAIDLASNLEMAYSELKNLGFSYERRTNWPVEVTIKKLESTVSGYSTNSIWGDNYGYMEFNFDKMGDAEEMKVTAGHEFFHLVQSLYDPRNRYSKAKFQSENLWIHEALSVWSEGLFSNKTDYVSGAFSTSAGMVVYGANDSGGDVANFYGYGMSAFMKYLSDNFGNGVFVKIYDEIYNEHNSFSAIDNVIPTPTFSFWDEFIQEYLTYSIYKGEEFKPQWLASEAASTGGSFVIRYDTDTVKTYSWNYKNLSAKIYSVRTVAASLSAIDENSQLVFETEGNILGNIQLFKENKEESVFLKQGEKTVTLDNFRSITDAGYVIIAVVTNSRLVAPYKETSSGELTIKVINKEADPTPVITEIVDRRSFLYNNTTHNFTLPNGEAMITGRNFEKNSKVYINGIESTLQYEMYDDTTGWFQMPELPGNISVKVVSDVGESNVYTYYCGLPLDYLASAESVEIKWRLIVNGFGFPLYLNPSDEVIAFSKDDFSWSGNILTVDLSKVLNVSGSIQYTFAANGNKIDFLKLDYERSNESPNEIVHYLGFDFRISQSGSKNKYGFYYSNQWSPDLLNIHTSSMKGSIDYDGDGNLSEFTSLRGLTSDQLMSMQLLFSQ